MKSIAWLTLSGSLLVAIYLFAAAGVVQSPQLNIPGTIRVPSHTEVNPGILAVVLMLILGGFTVWSLLLGVAHIAEVVTYGADYVLHAAQDYEDEDYVSYDDEYAEEDYDDSGPEQEGDLAVPLDEVEVVHFKPRHRT